MACCIILTGCAGGGKTPETQLATAQRITAKRNDVVFDMTVTETGCEITFERTQGLELLTLSFDGETLTANCDGLETEVPPLFAEGILPLYQGVLACKTPGWEDAAEGIRRISLDGKDFLVYYDPVGGLMTHLEVKGAEGTLAYQILSCIEKE